MEQLITVKCIHLKISTCCFIFKFSLNNTIGNKSPYVTSIYYFIIEKHLKKLVIIVQMQYLRISASLQKAEQNVEQWYDKSALGHRYT